MTNIYWSGENFSAVWMSNCINWWPHMPRTFQFKWLTWLIFDTSSRTIIIILSVDCLVTITCVSRFKLLLYFWKSLSFLRSKHFFVTALHDWSKRSISFLLSVCPSSFSISFTWIDFFIKFLSQSLRLRKHIRVMTLESCLFINFFDFMLRQGRVSH